MSLVILRWQRETEYQMSYAGRGNK